MAQQILLRQAFVKEWLDMISGCICRDQRSISPTFYDQPLSRKIPKAQKDIQVISVFLHFWDLYL
jgi:hypothetical protein